MHREDRTHAFCLVVVASSLLVVAEASGAQARRPGTLTPFDARMVEFAREGAMRRLRSPECQRVLVDFKDADGRPLADNLVPFAVPPDEYLAMIPILDDQNHDLCRADHSQLLTSPGVARVFVCKAFVATVKRERAMAEV